MPVQIFGARFYDPYLNRFIQPDSLVPQPGNPLAWDRYAYANNSPVKYVDPDGHIPVPVVPTPEYPEIEIPEWFEPIAKASCLLASCEVKDHKIEFKNDTTAVLDLVNPIGMVNAPIEKLTDSVDNISGYIYKKSSGSFDSLTPRPGKDDVDLINGGLSFFDSVENMIENILMKKGDKYVQVDPKKLDGLDVVLDNNPVGHVSVRPQSLDELKKGLRHMVQG